MNRVIIIKDCLKCPYSGQGTSHIGCRKTNRAIAINYIPDWCPLPPLPEYREYYHEYGQAKDFADGWNTCLDRITGRKD